MIRIMMFDNNEVFYQTINEDDTFVDSKYSTISYYRTSKDFFYKNSKFIKHLAFTETENEIHRPNLPLRLNCFSELFWTNTSFGGEIDFNEFLKSTDINTKDLTGIESSKVVIFPTSQQLLNKKSVLLENKNSHFPGKELMIQCFNIQSEYVKSGKPYFSRFRLIANGREEKRLTGIGIYRLGINRNVPSYYLGGEISMMELESY